ncbi:hypothetical protein H257_06393 [Aphanomyces astaci]|uniref:Anaphase-promoting complex subunit 4-like WD40 domain-containing protein n=2 Tax=Aphanomyces astaci TaxID=112090 RepID=W4GPZ1_APHAT|nr:hypothetical protein H257_06393 [Aphanomyces astaci]ETV80948.1 hypothetical protein H257_06393 [Aphanomyces astaci]|eukprot:XP_009829895.1 hypothetical protein H257_06393 [Aphanomyces astaci]
MSLLKEVNASATVAWSPIKHRSNLIALGSKDGVGVGFESYGGELQLMSMDFADVSPAPIQLGSIKTSSRFLSLSWADVVRHQSSMELGVLAGGMADGTVNIWDPSKIAANAPAEVGKVSRHKGPVNAVQFNPHPEMSHLLASGGGDGEVYVMSLDKLNAPQVYTPGGPNYTATPGNEITCLAWNTQVAHILASGSQNGSTVVWDMKSKKPFCELKDMSRSPVSCVAWNPNEGLHIITASSDDQRPVLRLWDLRSSTSTPLAELHGHTAGILSMSWCPNDAGFVLSSAKDNRTLLWDLFTGQPFFELPSNVPTQPVGGSFFSGGGGGQRRFNVQWSPKIPAVASACTFDGKVQVWGLTGSGTGATRAPKWSTRPVSASFGFGGKLVVTNARSSTPQQQQQYGQPKEFRPVHIHKISSDPSIVAGADLLEQALAQKDFQRHCDAKVASAKTPADKATWSFMKILFDRASARTQLLLHLGYDSNQIKADARTYLGKDEPLEAADTPAPLPPPQAQPTVSAADVFGAAPPPPDLTPPHTPPKKAGAIPIDTSERIQGAQGPTYTEASESIIKRLLLVGDFDAAVDVCLANFQLADALLLACQGGEELWVKTQEACLAAGKARPFMKIVKAMMKRDLAALVADSDGHQWTETLAILTTYATGDEFGVLVDQLAAKLEALGDVASATLCYMCSFNVEKTVTAWVKEAAIESKTRDSVLVLQDLIEKVSIFAQASDNPDQELNPQVASQFAAYASLMAGQGRLDIAGRYAKYADVSCAIIRDRIYHAAPNPQVRPPPSPFTEQAAAPANPRGQYQAPATAAYGQQAPAATGASRGGYGAAPQPAAYGATPQYQQPQQQQYANSGYNAQATAYPTPATPAYNTQTTPSAYPSQYGPNAPAAVGGYGAPSAYGSSPAPTAAYGGTPTPAYGTTPPAPQGYGAAPTQGAGYGAPAPTYGAPTPAYGAGAPGAPYRAPSAVPTPGYGGPASSSGGFQAQQPQGYAAAAPPPPAAVPAYNAPGVGFGAPQQGSAPPAHGGFAPPAAAALPNPSSRISTIPVDISKGKADGFVSSVGNKDLIRKYGNSTNAILSPTEKEKAAGFHNQPSPAPVAAAPAVVLGATDNVSAEDLPIVRGFNDLVALLEGSQLSPIEAKQLPEIQKSKDLLFTKLNTGELAPNVVKSLHDMVLAFARQDFRAAGQIHTSLTTTDWAQHKEWLRGVKTLINLGVKRFR